MSAQNDYNLFGGRYKLTQQIGQGGMGAVFRATDRLTGQDVALKRVSAAPDQLNFSVAGGHVNARLALAQEFRTLASLRHPHIISVLDYGFDSERRPYITMTLLENAQTLLAAGQGKSLVEKVQLLIQVLQALIYLHRRAILHRDLKPSNVLVLDGQIKVLDFGLAVAREHISEDHISGTLAYMAPEIMQGQHATEAADLYAVGVMAYELLVGRHPFDTTDFQKLISDVLSTHPDISPLVNISTHDTTETAYAAPTLQRMATSPTQVDEDTMQRSVLDMEKTEFLDKSIRQAEQEPSPIVITPTAGGEIPPLARTIAKLLAKKPEARFQDAAEVVVALSSAIGLPIPKQTSAMRDSFLQAALFVGRETEMGELNHAISAAIRGQGSAWLVGGESGVGKSRLMEELRAQVLIEGVNVLRGQATSEGGLPYQIWREPLRWLSIQLELSDFQAGVLKSLVPDIGVLLERDISDAPELDSQATQERLISVVETVFRHHRQPLMVILEDLHWAGSESLALLSRLASAAASLPVIIVGSFRNDERPELVEALPEMQVLSLNRLSKDDITKLSVSILGKAGRQARVIDYLERETEGNVFFLVEVVRALAEEAEQLDEIVKMSLQGSVFSSEVQRIIQHRLDRVPPKARPLLQLAAIVGRKLDLTVLRTVDARQNPNDQTDLVEWLTLCDNAAVLESLEGDWRFSHDKLREQILATLTPAQSSTLHRLTAEAIESVYPDDPNQVALLAYHWKQTDDKAKAIEYLDKAGEQASANHASHEAIAFLGDADKLDDTPLSEASINRHFKRLSLLGHAYLGAGLLVESRANLEKALGIVGFTIPRSQSRMVIGLLGQLVRQTRHRYFSAPISPDPEVQKRMLGAARIYEKLAEIFYFDNDIVATIYCAIYTLNLAERAQPSPELARAYANLTVTSGLAGLNSLADVYRTLALETAENAQDPLTLAQVLSRVSLHDTSIAQWERSEAALDRSLVLSEALGNFRQTGETIIIQANAFHVQGRFEESQQLCARLYELGIQNQDLQHQSWGAGYRAQSTLRLYQLEETEHLLHLLMQAYQTLPRSNKITFEILGNGLLSLTLLRLNRVEEASEFAAITEKLVTELPLPSTYAWLEGYAAIAEFYLLRLENEPEGKEAVSLRANAERGCLHLRQFSKRFKIVSARRYLAEGRLARLNSNPKEARNLLQKSLEHASASQLRYDEGMAHYYLARCFPHDAPQYRENLDAAAKIFADIGAALELEQIVVQT